MVSPRVAVSINQRYRCAGSSRSSDDYAVQARDRPAVHTSERTEELELSGWVKDVQYNYQEKGVVWKR